MELPSGQNAQVPGNGIPCPEQNGQYASLHRAQETMDVELQSSGKNVVLEVLLEMCPHIHRPLKKIIQGIADVPLAHIPKGINHCTVLQC